MLHCSLVYILTAELHEVLTITCATGALAFDSIDHLTRGAGLRGLKHLKQGIRAGAVVEVRRVSVMSRGEHGLPGALQTPAITGPKPARRLHVFHLYGSWGTYAYLRKYDQRK